MAKTPTAETSGIRRLSDTPNPSDLLYEEIAARLGRVPGWSKGDLVLANRLAQETGLARGTVTRTLLRLVTEGILEAQRGKGYRIVDTSERRRATTVVSVSEFCLKSGLECITVLDSSECRVQPLREFRKTAGKTADLDKVKEMLNVEDDERILLIRRARGFRPKGSRAPIQWAILETLYLLDSKLPHLEATVKTALQPATTSNPIGNLSLHSWMTSNGIEPERSEYSLRLSPLTGRDAKVWTDLKPRPHHPATKPFIRLEAVTYGRGRGPLLYTREHLVPDMFDLVVTGFRFREGAKLIEALVASAR